MKLRPVRTGNYEIQEDNFVGASGRKGEIERE